MNEYVWTELRERLNHDIMRNQVMTELAAIKASAQGSVPQRLSGWLRQAGEFRVFFDAAVDALDAGVIVNTALFSCWPMELKTACCPIFKELFLSMHAIRERVTNLHIRLADCESGARDFLQLRPQDRTMDQIVELERRFSDLSRGISDLPRPVWAGDRKSGEEIK